MSKALLTSISLVLGIGHPLEAYFPLKGSLKKKGPEGPFIGIEPIIF